MSEQNPQKLQKKIGKLKHLVRRHDGVAVSDTEISAHLAVSNIGVLNGIPRHAILDLFRRKTDAENAPLPVLRLCADRSFGYATFPSPSDALTARDALQGRTLTQPVSGQRLVVVSAFVDSIPASAFDEFSNKLPEGLTIIEEFVDESMEKSLLGVVEDDGRWNKIEIGDESSSQSLKHRRVRHFGYEFRYSTNDVDPELPLIDDPIPTVCGPIIDRLVAGKFVRDRPDQLTINRYEPGQGIPPHVDTHSAFADGIVSLSLGSAAVMDFKSLVSGKQVPVYLKPRSLIIMSGTSRYSWTHAICPRKYDVVMRDQNENEPVAESNGSPEYVDARDVKYRGTRTSFTFRKILPDRRCACSFPDHCDTSRGSNVVARSTDSQQQRESTMTPWQLEATHVHRVYDEIAPHFSSTRHTPWPKVKEFVVSLAKGSAILDVGCGNGKYFGLQPDNTFFEVGCDRSLNLSAIAAERGFNALGAEALSLPLRDAIFDAVISIAVVHHLTTPERRAAAIAEMLRVTRVGGQILVTVWAFEQKRKEEGKSKYLGKKDEYNYELGDAKEVDKAVDAAETNERAEESAECLNVADLEIHENRTDFKKQDLLVPWHFKRPKQKSSKLEGDECNEGTAATAERVFHRYYHVFKERELERMIESIPGYRVQILRSYYDQGNWGVVFRKL